ncbi:MAG: HAD family phosphatase [Acidobacteriota bacterium]|jgi:HAD superfamily hydrolase (TIGR01509 family)
MIDAVIFDMDGLLVDSEPLWLRARAALMEQHRGTWTEADQLAMAGVHTDIWVEALRAKLDGTLSAQEVFDDIVTRMTRYYQTGEVPVLPGASQAIVACAERYRVGLASGSPQRLIDACLAGLGWAPHFECLLSSDELEHGKPAPDVYLEIMRRMGLDAPTTAVVEDSGAGIRSGKAAGARVVAVPNQHTHPGADVLALADVCIDSLDDLPAALERL